MTLDGFQVTPLHPGTAPTWHQDSKRSVSPPSSLSFGDPATHTYKSVGQKVGAKATSPAIDAGTAAGAPEKDILGRSRACGASPPCAAAWARSRAP